MIFKGLAISSFLRGDDDALLVALADGQTFETGDKVYFCLRETSDEQITDLFQIEVTTFLTHNGVADAAARIDIPHSLTIDLPLTTYYYTVWVEWAGGGYKTLIPLNKFTLKPGGSHV